MFWALLGTRPTKRRAKKRRSSTASLRRGHAPEVLESRLLLAQVAWVGGDGFWDEGANWSGGAVPAASDDVTIDVAGDVSVTVRDFRRIGTITGTDRLVLSTGGELEVDQASAYHGVIEIAGGVLDLDAELVANNGVEWSAGTIDTISAKLSLPSGTTSLLTSNTAVSHAGASGIDLSGTLVHFGDGNLAMSSGAVITVQDGALYDLQSDADVVGPGAVVNLGEVRKSSGTGESRFDAFYVMQPGGITTVETGRLTSANSNNSVFSTGGAIHVEAGAVFDLTGGKNMLYGGSYTGTGGGTILLESARLTTAGAGLAFDMAEGLFEMTGGSLFAASARPFTNDGFMQLTGDADKTLASTFINNNTVIQTGLGNVNGGSITNSEGALWDFQSDGGFGTATMQFFNIGTVRKSSGTGTTDIESNNSDFIHLGGTVEVTSGNLSLGKSGNNALFSTGGHFIVAAGSTVDLTGGNRTLRFTGTYTGEGEGRVELSQGSLFAEDGGAFFEFDEGVFHQTGGTIHGSVANPFVNNEYLQFSGDADKALASTFINNNTVIQTGLGNVNGGSITNSEDALWDFQSDGGFGTATLQFYNMGTVRKSGGTGTTDIESNNSDFIHLGGTVEVASGNLSLGKSGNNLLFSTGAHFIVAAGSAVDLTGGNRSLRYTGTYTGEGEGRVELSQGSLTAEDGGAFFEMDEGVFHWVGGTIRSTLDIPFENIGHMTISGDGDKSNAGFMTNRGTVIHVDAGTVLSGRAGTGSRWFNRPGSLYHFTGSGAHNSTGFLNEGVLRKTGDGTAQFNGSYDNVPGGSIDVQGGELNLARGSSHDSTSIHVETDSILRFTGTPFHTLAGVINGTGTGRVELTGRMGGDIDNKPRLNFEENLFHWLGSGGLNSTNFINDGFIHLSGNENQSFRGNIVNHGTFVHESDSTFVMNQTSEFNNLGTFEFRGDGDFQIIDFSRIGSVIHNLGTIVKTAGFGTSRIFSNLTASSFLNNTGTIDVQIGTVELETRIRQLEKDSSDQGTLHGGTWRVGEFSTLSFLPDVDIINNYGNVILDGVGSTFAAIDSIALNAGRFELLSGRDFTTVGDFTNGAERLNTQMTDIFHLGRERQAGLAIDPETGNLFFHARNETFIGEYDRDGVQISSFEQPINPTNLTDLEFTSSPIDIGGVVVPTGTLLMTLGDSAPPMVYAMDKTDGTILTSVTLDTLPAGLPGVAHHPGRGTLFVLSADRNVYEIDAANGSVLNSFTVNPAGVTNFLSYTFAGIEVQETTGNLFIVGTGETGVREMLPTGEFVADYDLTHLGPAIHSNSTRFSSIALDNTTGDIWILEEVEAIYKFAPFEIDTLGDITVGPGSTLDVNGDYEEVAAQTLNIQIAGRPATGGFGKLVVTGDANLSGTIHVELVSGFGPVSGDAYEVISYATRSGDDPAFTGIVPNFESRVESTRVVLDTVATASDLAIDPATISGPTEVRPGANVAASFAVENLSSSEISGTWVDSLLLSRDRVLSPDDLLIGTSTQTAPVPAHESYIATITGKMPAVLEGEWYLIGVADGGRAVADVDRSNNIGIGNEKITSQLPLIAIGEEKNVTLQQGQSRYFRIDIPVESSNVLLEFAADIPDGAVEIFVDAGRLPTRSSFSQHSSEFDSPTASLQIINPPPGEPIYILIHGRDLALQVDGRLTATIPPLMVDRVAQREVGNEGTATLEIFGFQLSDEDTFELVRGNLIIDATNVVVDETGTVAWVTFDVDGVALGRYDLKVAQQPPGDEVALDDAVEIVQVDRGELSVELLTPGSFRSVRVFAAEVVYRNDGNVDMPASLLVLTSANAKLNRNRGEAFTSDTLVLLAASKTGPAGILRPGETHRLTFRALPNSVAPLQLQLDEQPAVSDAPVDWEQVESDLRPDSIPNEQWDPFWDPFVTAAGNTWGGYVSLLAAYAERTKEAGGDPTSAFEVFQFARSDLYAEAFANVRGAVMSENSPVAGATVVLQNINPDLPSVIGSTATDGTFRLIEVPDGTYDVFVEGHQLSGPSRVEVPVATELEVQVSLGGSIEGVVRRMSDALLLADAEITLEAEDGMQHSARSDTDGTFRIIGLPDGVYQLRAMSHALGTEYVNEVTIENGTSITNVDIELSASASVIGRVLSNTTPIAGASILAHDSRENVVSTITDASGAYKLVGLSADTWTLLVGAVGFIAEEAIVTTVAGADTQAPDFNLQTTFVFDVNVVDESGQPVPSASVELRSDDEVIMSAESTNADGIATLTGLIPGDYSLVVAAEGLLTVRRDLVITGSSDETIMLAESGILGGRVTDAGGDPIEGISVRVIDVGSTFEFRETTDADGRYAFDALPAGTHFLTVGNNSGILRTDVQVVDGETATQDVTVPGIVVSGRVRAPDGSAVAGSTVFLSQLGRTVATAETDASGDYLFRVLATGSFGISATNGSGLTDATPVTTASDDIVLPDIQFTSDTFSVDVVDASGIPIPNSVVMIAPAADDDGIRSLLAQTDALGRATFDGVATGTYVVEVGAAGFAPSLTSFTVSSSDVVEVELSAGVRFSGVVTTATDDPVEGAEINVHDPVSGLVRGLGRTRADGSYTTTRLLPGTYDIVVSHPDFQSVVVEDVAVDAGTNVDAVLPEPSTTLTGTVTDSFGTPLAEVVVGVTNARGELVASEITTANGTYASDTLPEGVYDVTYALLGYQVVQSSSALVNGQITTANASLAVTATDDLVLTPWAVGSLTDSIIDWIRERNPEPERDRFDTGTSPPVPDLSDAEKSAAWFSFVDARDNKEAAFESWESSHANFNTTILTSVPQFTLQLANLIGSVVSLTLPVGQAIQGANTLGRGTVVALTATNLMLGVKGAFENFAKTANSGGATVDNVFNLEASLSSVLNGLSGAGGLIDEIGSELGSSTGGGGPSPLGVFDAINNLIALVRDTIGIIKDLRNLGDSVPDARDNYLNAFEQELTRREALGRLRCRPDEPDPPPETEPRILRVRRSIGQGRSSDPNDKLTIGLGEQGHIRAGDTITYTIRFENMSTATLPAQEVFVFDTLSNKLDWSTIELLAIGLNNVEYDLPEGLTEFEGRINVPTDDFPVNTAVTFDTETGELNWTMRSVDPLIDDLPEVPEAGFLPPNDNTGRGEGFLVFRVQVIDGLADEAVIENSAAIIFDDNETIVTNTTLNTIDDAAPTSSIDALPPETNTENFIVRWSGNDGSGSGIAHYDVFVSEDGGAFELWQDATTETVAPYAGQFGHTYAFFSIATDELGLQEQAPTTADAVTTVALTDPSPPKVTAVVVQNGLTQRSHVDGLQFELSEDVNLAELISSGDIIDAIVLTNLGIDVASDADRPVPLTADQFVYEFDDDAGVSRLTWSLNASDETHASLADGVYELVIDSTQVRDISGNALDGDGDGIAGDNYTFRFHRLAGDADGNRVVDQLDMQLVNTALGAVPTSSSWNPNADLDHDGRVTVGDRLIVFHHDGHEIILDESTLGDFDFDGDNDGNDFLAWQRNLGNSNTAVGDADLDGKVSGTDLSHWQANFGITAGSGAIATSSFVAAANDSEPDTRQPFAPVETAFSTVRGPYNPQNLRIRNAPTVDGNGPARRLAAIERYFELQLESDRHVRFEAERMRRLRDIPQLARSIIHDASWELAMRSNASRESRDFSSLDEAFATRSDFDDFEVETSLSAASKYNTFP